LYQEQMDKWRRLQQKHKSVTNPESVG